MGYLQTLVLIAMVPFLVKGQDLFSFGATRQFADYLFAKGEYGFASEEYGRLFFMQPQNDTIMVRLSQTYRKQGNYSLATDLFRQHRSTGLDNRWLEQEYIATLLFQHDEAPFEEALSATSHIPTETILRSRVEFAMLNRDWKKASGHLEGKDHSGPWVTTYRETLQNAQAFRPRKPWLAATCSAIIPGSGKVYARNVKEGITSFFFVAAMGYQSYRAFNRRGSKSVTGWIYGGLGLGFYLGNIYGAQQSAKNYNKRRLDAIYHEVDQLIYSRY